MRTLLLAFIGVALLGSFSSPTFGQAPSAGDVETLVAVRHGEKPPGGLGNLDCQGLNRALALPNVLLAKYGKPDFVFAPNPTEKADGGKKGGKYYYVRPLMTIEPTAIRCGLPVNTAFGFSQIQPLADELKKPEYRHALVFIAWEHGWLDQFARLMVKSYGGHPGEVPEWPGKDYDTIFVFRITHHDGAPDTLAFTIDHEGLNNLSTACPGPAK